MATGRAGAGGRRAWVAVAPAMFLATVFATLTPSAARPPPPRVVATLAPVHSLVAQVMEGVGRPLLLLAGAASPHGTTLRPSQMRALRRADIVFWVGAGFETFLARPLESMAGTSRIVTLTEHLGMDLIPARPGRGQAESDAHIWLDPANAIRILGAAEAALAAADGANAWRYRANGKRASGRLRALDRKLGAMLKAVQGIPYVVFHDAYRYFERRYRLSPVARIAVVPGRAPGAGRLRRIRRNIAAGRIGCVFTEPQFPPRLAAMLITGTGARLGVLDPLGTGLPPGAAQYAGLMRNLARALVDCLSPSAFAD